MIQVSTRRHGDARRRAISVMGADFYKGEWMESGTDAVRSPTISLIEQAAHSTLGTHFHRQNQFQLFVHGGGTIGPQALEPVTIHYAGAYTGYGPLIAGAEGVHYFTIRPVCEVGAVPVEQAREHMVRGPKRHAQAGPVHCLADTARKALTAVQTDDVIPVGPDGLGARVVRLPPHHMLAPQVPAATDCTFAIVLAGELSYEGAALTRFEGLYVSADDEFPAVSAGASGAELVLLFVPPKAVEYL